MVVAAQCVASIPPFVIVSAAAAVRRSDAADELNNKWRHRNLKQKPAAAQPASHSADPISSRSDEGAAPNRWGVGMHCDARCHCRAMVAHSLWDDAAAATTQTSTPQPLHLRRTRTAPQQPPQHIDPSPPQPALVSPHAMLEDEELFGAFDGTEAVKVKSKGKVRNGRESRAGGERRGWWWGARRAQRTVRCEC